MNDGRAAIHCPACQGTVPQHAVQRYCAEEAAQHFVLAEAMPDDHRALVRHIRTLWGGEHCEVLACPACALHFAWPFVAGDARFYNLAYPHSDYPEQRWEFLQTVQALSALPRPTGQVLEIGSGFGYFLRQVSPRWVEPDRVVAVEYNDTARSKLLARGYTALGQDVRSAAFDALAGQVDALFMFQVLEHMDDLGGLVQRLRQLLRPGAHVFIATPNPERIAFNEAHGSLCDMLPNHISRWTPAAFRALARRAGWTMVEHRTEPLRWRDLVRQDLVFAHMRRAQRSGSLANRLAPARAAARAWRWPAHQRACPPGATRAAPAPAWATRCERTSLRTDPRDPIVVTGSRGLNAWAERRA